MKVALDAMGGDNAPAVIIEGAAQALQSGVPIDRLFLVGHEDQIRALMEKFGIAHDPRVEVVHASQVVEMHESPADAIRRKKDASVSRAVDLVKRGEVQAIVTAGHTGAAVAATTLKLRTLPGVERPAIATVLPHPNGFFVLVDSGANIDCKPIQLLQFAIMGAVYANILFDVPDPRVGLLSIGEEVTKGNELTRNAHLLLKQSPLNFIGNVEGKRLFTEPVDVVVCDGFVGNVVLKTSESIAAFLFSWIKRAIMSSWMARLGGLLAAPALHRIKKKSNYEEYGGAPLLGVNGICIIGHGSSSPKAVRNAISLASTSIQKQMNQRIVDGVAKYGTRKVIE